MEKLKKIIEGSPYGSTDWGGTRLVLIEDAYGDNIFRGGKDSPCFVARAVNADARIYKCIWMDTPPEGMPDYWYEDPDHYIDWDKCDDAIGTEYYEED